MKDFNTHIPSYRVIKDPSKEWPKTGIAFLGNAPVAEASPLLFDRTLDVIIEVTTQKADELSVVLDPLIEQLEAFASSFQHQSISIILDELCTNAVHHSGPGNQTIRIVCQRSAEKVIAITVVDQGGVLPESQIKRLFLERTIPVSPRNDPSHRGAGLGLFFCLEFSSGLFIQMEEGISTSITCLVPHRPSKKSTLVTALVSRRA